MFGIRKKIKSTIKNILHLDNAPMPQSTAVEPEQRQANLTPQTTPPSEEVYKKSEATDQENTQPYSETQFQQPQSAQEGTEQKKATEADPHPASEAGTSAPKVVQATELNPTEGKALTVEAVQEILDDDIRPALQSDGGDITLIKIEDNNIYVKLVGACSTCPSSVATMGMFVKNLLKEEFPSLEDVIEVHDEPTLSAATEDL